MAVREEEAFLDESRMCGLFTDGSEVSWTIQGQTEYIWMNPNISEPFLVQLWQSGNSPDILRLFGQVHNIIGG